MPLHGIDSTIQKVIFSSKEITLKGDNIDYPQNSTETLDIEASNEAQRKG